MEQHIPVRQGYIRGTAMHSEPGIFGLLKIVVRMPGPSCMAYRLMLNMIPVVMIIIS
jgi:hypothetical protein